MLQLLVLYNAQLLFQIFHVNFIHIFKVYYILSKIINIIIILLFPSSLDAKLRIFAIKLSISIFSV